MNNYMIKYDKIIFCDLDGTLCDFSNGFSQLPGSKGLTSVQYDAKYGENSIWKVIDAYGKAAFFEGLPWMTDGKELWNYISDNFLNVRILTALGRSDKLDGLTRKGKRAWLYRNIPELGDEDILMVPNKHSKKHYAKPGDILIDDTDVCIQEWKKAGGIGILHKNTKTTISQLEKLV